MHCCVVASLLGEWVLVRWHHADGSLSVQVSALMLQLRLPLPLLPLPLLSGELQVRVASGGLHVPLLLLQLVLEHTAHASVLVGLVGVGAVLVPVLVATVLHVPFLLFDPLPLSFFEGESSLLVVQVLAVENPQAGNALTVCRLRLYPVLLRPFHL